VQKLEDLKLIDLLSTVQKIKRFTFQGAGKTKKFTFQGAGKIPLLSTTYFLENLIEQTTV
jgi:hypothetical protein